MNTNPHSSDTYLKFLNGVCRHELCLTRFDRKRIFLNGVCRHELDKKDCHRLMNFLNGVCRHERLGC